MAARQRRRSLDWTVVFSELTDKLKRNAASFISAFDLSEPQMRQIVRELQKIADEVKEMQEMTDEQRRKGVRMGLILMAVAPLTFGLSLIGAAAAAADVVDANKTKIKEERESVHKVEELGIEFMEIVEPLKVDLEEIKTTCEELEKISAKVQAVYALSDVEVFHRILGQVSKLAERNKEVLGVAVTVMAVMRNLLMLIVSVFRVTATPEEDQKLRDSIIQSAFQCQKVVDEFDQMKMELLAIREQARFWDQVATNVQSSQSSQSS